MLICDSQLTGVAGWLAWRCTSQYPLPGSINHLEPFVVRMTAEQASVLSFVHERSELLIREPVLIGTTRWAASCNGAKTFLAWRWALITRDVVCIESTLDVESNLFVFGEDPVAKRRRLNFMISELDWQPTVIKLLRSAATDRPPQQSN